MRRLLSLRNILYIITFIVALLFLSIVAYKLYNSYQKYQNIKEKNQAYYYFNDLNRLLQNIEDERLLSSIYLSTQLSYDELQEKRAQVDRLLEDSKLSFNEVISKVRSRVDNHKIDNKEMIYDIYEKQIIEPIFTKMQENAFSKIEQNILLLAKLHNSLALEDSFLAYMLLKSKSMQSSDLKFWDNIGANRVKPPFMHSKIFSSKSIDKMYTQIFLDSKSGNYSIGFDKWNYLTIQKLKRINQLENTFKGYEVKNLNKEISEVEYDIKKYFVLLLLLVFLFLFVFLLIYFIFKMKKDAYYLKNTLKNIEVDIDIEKRRELEYLLKRNDKIEIYKFLANAIKEPNRAKDLFLANMSHEIRTPLNGIVGFTKELRQTPLNSDQEEMLSIIEESSNQLIHIVNDILDFSKIKAGKVELEYISFDPISTFESSVDTFIAKAREKKIELKVNIDPDIPRELIGDPTKLSQILSNLISNAIKFTEEKGLVVISMLKVMESNESVQLKFIVKDSGIGVSREEQKRIFDAFSQADVSTNRKYGGTGLGLSISRQFIQYMGGELEMQSEVGEGTSFYFSLNLEKGTSSTRYNRLNLSSYMVGYVPPITPQCIDKYLKNYVEFYGAKFKSYNRYEILNLEKGELPDLLFMDYKCFKSKQQLEVFLNLPLQTILIVADNREDELIEVRDKIDYILHKPVNFTRTLKALESIKCPNRDSHLVQEHKGIRFVNKRALVAEDNKINQKLMKSILERYGFEIEIVENGKEAIESYKNSSFDIIFMDIQMPTMGGEEATKRILALERESLREHTPIIALTANALEGDKEKYLGFGMDGYLSKPINMESLEEILVASI